MGSRLEILRGCSSDPDPDGKGSTVYLELDHGFGSRYSTPFAEVETRDPLNGTVTTCRWIARDGRSRIETERHTRPIPAQKR